MGSQVSSFILPAQPNIFSQCLKYFCCSVSITVRLPNMSAVSRQNQLIVLLIITFSVISVTAASIYESRRSMISVEPIVSNQESNNRVKRKAQQVEFSIINNFEVLRQRYLDTLRDRNARPSRRPRIIKTQIRENQNFLDVVG